MSQRSLQHRTHKKNIHISTDFAHEFAGFGMTKQKSSRSFILSWVRVLACKLKQHHTQSFFLGTAHDIMALMNRFFHAL